MCPRCGFRTDGEAAFCSRCGERIATDEPARGPARYVPSVSSRHTPVNRLAAASIVFAVAWIWGIGSLLAVVCGSMARRAIEGSGGRVGGGGLAVMAIVLGWIGLACALVVLVG